MKRGIHPLNNIFICVLFYQKLLLENVIVKYNIGEIKHNGLSDHHLNVGHT